MFLPKESASFRGFTKLLWLHCMAAASQMFILCDRFNTILKPPMFQLLRLGPGQEEEPVKLLPSPIDHCGSIHVITYHYVAGMQAHILGLLGRFHSALSTYPKGN